MDYQKNEVALDFNAGKWKLCFSCIYVGDVLMCESKCVEMLMISPVLRSLWLWMRWNS